MQNSPDLLMKVPNLQGIVDFFKNTLEVLVEDLGGMYLVNTQHYKIYLQEDEIYSITFEFITDNYDKDREKIIKAGCEPNKSDIEERKNWLQHKSGFLFNLYAKHK